VITDTCIADTSISRENVLGCQLSFIFSTSDRPLEPTPHARHTRTQNRYGCQNVRNAVQRRAECERRRRRGGSEPAQDPSNGTERTGSPVSASMISAWSPHAHALHAMHSPFEETGSRRRSLHDGSRSDDPRPPAQSLWAATVSGARRRLKPPLTPLASPRQVEAPFPRAYSAYELNSAVLPSLLATPHPIHTVAKVPPVAKLPAVETSPPVARSETRATPWCRTLYVLHRIWLRREQSHDRGHDRRHLTGLDCRLRVEGCAKFERKRRRIAFRQGD